MTRKSPHTATVLRLLDAKRTPVQIIGETGLSKRIVYAILRRHRPTRLRAPRTRTSSIPAQVRRMDSAGIEVRRIAELLGISPVYAYKILQDAAGQ